MRSLLLLMAAVLGLLGMPTAALANVPVARWAIYEFELTSDRAYGNPLWDAEVAVHFTGPSGEGRTVDAFWDGGRTWRVRFSPGEVGRWKWRTACSDEGNGGLHERSGEFTCAEYDGDNKLIRRGPPRVSEDGTHLVYADGTPLFWLADTAWNGALKSEAEDWEKYLEARREQKFTAIQFVSTQWRGGKETLDEHAFTGRERVEVNPSHFQRLDERVEAIHEHGLIPSPVVLWALTEADPGQALPLGDAIRLAKYIVARWGAYPVVWHLGGDGDYRDEKAERWRKIGRAVFGEDANGPGRLATMHPMGQTWIAEEFREEAWYDLITYQSGHGDSDANLQWLVTGPPARAGRRDPSRPIINTEPNYEAHPAYQSGEKHGPHHVRRAAYWSNLVAPTAGLTYGHNAIWVWNERTGPAEGHGNLKEVEPWYTGLDTGGIRSMTVMREFFESGPWTDLRPAPDLLADQPGKEDPKRFIAAAKTGDGKWAVLYLPVGGEVTLETDELKRPAAANWFDPRTGESKKIGPIEKGEQTFTAPDGRDWVLEVRSAE